MITHESKPGDVVAYCPDQNGPAVSRLLRDVQGLHQLTFPDGARPERVNWSDYLDRIDRADPAKFAQRVLDRAGNNTVWYVNTPGLLHLGGKCEEVGRAFGATRAPRDRITPDANSFFEVDGLTEYRAP